MDKLILSLYCDLDDNKNEIKLCNKLNQKGLKWKKMCLLAKNFSNKKRQIPKVNEYIKIIKQYPNDIFFSHFRMNRSTFQALLSALKPFWRTFKNGRLSYNLEQCLYMTLWKLSNNGVTFRLISDRFNVGKGTAHKIFHKTIKTICLLKKEISWPSVSEQKILMESFQNARENPFPHVVGCIDGSHLKISKPKVDAISYYNRKGFYSINLQAICDSRFRFLDVFIGYPGSCHDANVWKNSPIYNKISSQQVPLAPNAIILGDSAYPISKYLLNPYRDNGHLTREQKKFNYCLSSTRVFIEQAFGILKNKFRILDHLNFVSLKNVSEIVLACTILHNFIIKNGSPSEYTIPDTTTLENENSTNPISNEIPVADEDEDGVSMRNYLTTLFSC